MGGFGQALIGGPANPRFRGTGAVRPLALGPATRQDRKQENDDKQAHRLIV